MTEQHQRHTPQPSDRPQPAAERGDETDGGAFQAAVDAEVARRVDAVERRWQSRKDREMHRARQRWEAETPPAAGADLGTLLADADPRAIGQLLVAGIMAGLRQSAEGSATPDAAPAAETVDAPAAPARQDAAGRAAAPDNAAPPDVPARPTAAAPDNAAPPDSPARPAAPAAPAEREAADQEADSRERLADRRAQEPSPDLLPSLPPPADAFHDIESRFARGELDLEAYEAARRRRGLT